MEKITKKKTIEQSSVRKNSPMEGVGSMVEGAGSMAGRENCECVVTSVTDSYWGFS